MKPFYIGLVGKQGSGKDTIAEILTKVWKPRVMGPPESSLAYSLKIGISAIFGISKETMFDLPAERKNEVPVSIGRIKMPLRILMQRFGTECMRNLSPDIHVNLLLERVTKSKKQIIIVPDVRFEDEAEFIRSNGLLFRIKRRVKNEVGTTHSSETAVDKIEVEDTIDNDKSLTDLEEEVLRKICSKVPDEIFKEKFEGYTPVRSDAVKYFLDNGVWKDKIETGFYMDIETPVFMSMLETISNDNKTNGEPGQA